jgi:hypothetical protein
MGPNGKIVQFVFQDPPKQDPQIYLWNSDHENSKLPHFCLDTFFLDCESKLKILKIHPDGGTGIVLAPEQKKKKDPYSCVPFPIQ